MTRLVAVVLVLFAVALVGCDSTEPLTGTQAQTVGLTFLAEGNSIFEVDMWDRYVDANNNNQVDSGEEPAGFFCGDFYTSSFGRSAAPTTFTVDIRVVRGGSVVQEVLTTANSAANFMSATQEDGRVVTGLTPAQPPFPEPGFAYNNPRRVPDTSYAYLESCLTDVPLPVLGQVGGLPVPVEISLQRGDTVIVTAGQAMFPLTNYDSPGGLEVQVFIDGAPAPSQAIVGFTTVEPNGTLRFSYQYE